MKINNEYKDKALFYLRQMNDIRFAGQALFVVLVLLISWSGVKSIQANYELQKQISTLKQQNDLQKLQNDNLALQNQYYNSHQYLELAARQNFGLAARGETEVVVPKDVALSYTVNLPDDAKPEADKGASALPQRNFKSWVDFFLHRQAADPNSSASAGGD